MQARTISSLALWLPPAALILGGLLLGLVTERRRVSAGFSRPPKGVTSILLSSMRGMAVTWFLLAGLAADAGGDPGYEPPVRFTPFGDSSIGLGVTLRAREFSDIALLTHEFVKRITRRFAEDGITIPFPARTIHLTDNTRKT